MNANEKLQVVETELERYIKKRKKAKDGAKRKSFILKMVSVFFAALITVLLGLSNVGQYDVLLKNIALALGAIIMVVNAYEAFYDHRSLWIGQTITLTHLYKLRFDINFYKTGAEPDEIDIKRVTKFKNRFNRIVQDAMKNWLKIRNEDEKQLDEPQSDAQE